ncbi:MAG: hypothetical protein J5836_03455 [Clostridia bacterium]|nr:hypothetical protein [Clostridia bacterium]
MVITFCGHSNLSLVNEEKHKLYLTIKSEIIKNPNCIFYLGAYGDFDILCRRIVFCLKQQYKNVKAVFITPYLDGNYSRLKYANEYFDETIYPPIERVPKKLAIIKRNEWMVDNADLVIAYVQHSFGGAAKTLKYAKRRKKTIINIVEV